jgi:hypothetical protein
MLGKQKQRLKELEQTKEFFRWEIEEIQHADMDLDRKVIYLNDAQYSHYMLEQEIEAIEHDIAMFPFKAMLVGFIIFVFGMIVYMAM